MKKNSIIIILITTVLLLPLAAENYYDTGSQMFSITAGVDLPFTNSYKGEDGSWTSIPSTESSALSLSMRDITSLSNESSLKEY